MQHVPQGTQAAQGADKKLATGLCAIFLGWLGVHKFLLGYNQEGIILLAGTFVAWVVTFITCGIGSPLLAVPFVIGVIEGIIYLTKTDPEFYQTYIQGKKPWF